MIESPSAIVRRPRKNKARIIAKNEIKMQAKDALTARSLSALNKTLYLSTSNHEK